MDTPDAAAEIAHAISDGMDLLFLLAAPRILATARGLGAFEREHALDSLRRFLHNASGIRARSRSSTSDTDRLVNAAMLAEEIAGILPATPFEQPMPDAVVGLARRALAILGVAEPAGGWDDFDGFPVAYPPVS